MVENLSSRQVRRLLGEIREENRQEKTVEELDSVGRRRTRGEAGRQGGM